MGLNTNSETGNECDVNRWMWIDDGDVYSVHHKRQPKEPKGISRCLQGDLGIPLLFLTVFVLFFIFLSSFLLSFSFDFSLNEIEEVMSII